MHITKLLWSEPGDREKLGVGWLLRESFPTSYKSRLNPIKTRQMHTDCYLRGDEEGTNSNVGGYRARLPGQGSIKLRLIAILTVKKTHTAVIIVEFLQLLACNITDLPWCKTIPFHFCTHGNRENNTVNADIIQKFVHFVLFCLIWLYIRLSHTCQNDAKLVWEILCIYTYVLGSDDRKLVAEVWLQLQWYPVERTPRSTNVP